MSTAARADRKFPLFRTTTDAAVRRRSRKPVLEALESRTVLSVTVASSFPALDFNTSGGYVPPDTNGAAGPTQYVETVNQQIAIYAKSTGVRAATTPLSTFFFTTGGLTRADSGSGLSDPVVVYDEHISRFIIGDQDVNFTTHVSTFDIAVSKTSSPTTLSTSDWTFYRIVTTESGYDADYPGNLGYNKDALVVTLNMFSTTNGAGHVQIVSVNTTDLQNGAASPGTYKNDLNDFSVRPTTMHTSVTGDPMWLVTEHGDGTSIDVIKMGNVLSSSATFGYTNLPVTAYSGAVAPINPNGTKITTNIDSRIQKAAAANNVLVAAHTVSSGTTQDVVQWYSVDLSGASPVLKDKGRVGFGANTYAYYPAIDINTSGQIGLTYMKSGNDTSTDYMSMYVTGRLSTDAAGTMQTPVIVPAGTGVANYKDFSTGGRAGDLAGINLDPSDGSFWAANEFANTQATANWGTAVAHFSISNPFPTTDMAVSVSGPSSIDVTAGATNVTYTITVTNNGPASASGVVLTDTLPAGSTFVSLTQSSGTDAFTVGQSGSSATATASGSIASGSVNVFTLVVTAPGSLANGSTFTDTASVSESNPDSLASNNSATASASVVNTNTSADLSVSVSAPSSGTEGGNITYTITVTNNGPATASSVTLLDNLASVLGYRSATTTAGTFSVSGGVVTFALGNIAAGGTVTATVTAQSLEEGTVANTASVSSSTSPDPVSTNNTASATTSVAEAAIVVSNKINASGRSLTNFVAGTFTHANGIEPASAFIATINWGDGTTSIGTVTLSGTTYSVTGSHTYASGNRHSVTISVVESGPTPNSVEVIDKGDDEHPGRGGWRQQDVVHLPPRLARRLLHPRGPRVRHR